MPHARTGFAMLGMRLAEPSLLGGSFPCSSFLRNQESSDFRFEASDLNEQRHWLTSASRCGKALPAFAGMTSNHNRAVVLQTYRNP